MKFKQVYAALLVAVFFISGCDDSQYRRAVRASAGISSGVERLQDANELALKAGEIDPDAARAIALAGADIIAANRALRLELRSVKKLDTQSKAAIVAHIREIAASVQKLNEDGVLKVKNPDSQAKFAAILAGVDGSLAVLQSLMEAK
jgi:hypothetical protein